MTLAYEPAADSKIKFTVTVVGQKWFALGFNSAGTMDGTDAVLLKQGTDSRDNGLYTITGYNADAITQKSCPELAITETSMASTTGSSISFEYDPAGNCFRSGFGCTKNVSSGEISCASSKVIFALGSEFSDSSSDSSSDGHGHAHSHSHSRYLATPTFGHHQRAGAVTVDFTTAGTTNVVSDSGRGFAAHAVLMVLGWGALLPSGVITARFFKGRKDGRRPDCWYQMHRVMQVTGLLLAIIGLIVVVQTNSGKHVWDGATTGSGSFIGSAKGHGTLGLVIMALGLQQPILAMVRPHPTRAGEAPTAMRVLWEYGHKGLGYTAIVLAICQIFGGFKVLGRMRGCDKEQDEGSSEMSDVCGEIKIGFVFYTLVLLILCCIFVNFQCHNKDLTKSPATIQQDAHTVEETNPALEEQTNPAVEESVATHEQRFRM
jgi:hypothetical protein